MVQIRCTISVQNITSLMPRGMLLVIENIYPAVTGVALSVRH
jgi:hypothetical protein